MKIVDFHAVKLPEVTDSVIFAAGQRIGARENQEDFFLNYNDECFAIADGVGGWPHGETAAALAVETAIWGYKHIRQRPYYWSDKRKLLKRIFRTTNMSVWQKRRETGFAEGLASTLSMLIVSPTHYWVGTAGDSPIYLYRDGLIDCLTDEDVDETGKLTKAIGIKRLGLVPHTKSEPFLLGDTLALVTDGVSRFVSEDELRSVFEIVGNDATSAGDAVAKLLAIAEKNGSKDNMTACFVKRVPLLSG